MRHYRARDNTAGAFTIAAIATPARRPARLSVLALALTLVSWAGCGDSGGGGGDGPCAAVSKEPLDPRSTQHLLPGAAEPEYSSDPPTSGPHSAGDPPTGAQRQPVSRPEQVTVLETGGIMIQYRDLDGIDRRRLEALAGPQVVTAPNPRLPGEVVATAWRHRLTCPGAGEGEVDAIAAFIDAHRGKGPG